MTKKTFTLKGNKYIELKNVLKLLNYVNSGGEAKVIIQNGEISVNNEVETRRGRKLYPGDTVQVKGEIIEIATS